MSTILVVGSTGLLGTEICRLLSAEGRQVRGMVRATSNPEKVSRLEGFGVEIVRGDARQPASLGEAFQGAGAVISTISSMPFSYEPGANDLQTTDIQGSLNLIEAARAAHVSHFVYTSIPEQFAVDFPLQSAKIQVEKALKESGLVYTILQPTYFMELWLSPAVGFDAANAKAVIYGMGENGISWISLYDVARFAVACLDNPAAKNTTLLLGGPAAVSPSAVVKLFEQAANRPFEVQHVPEEALQAQQAAASDPMQQSFTGLMRCYAQGRTIDMSATAETFAIQPTPLEEYVKRALALA